MKRKHFILALAAMLLSFAPPIFAQKVAKVGDTEYATLAEAISKASAGGTVELIADAEESKTIVIGKALNIDGAGYTFTGAIEFNKSSANYTIKNVKFNGAGTRQYALKTTSSTGTLTVEGCTVTGYTYGFLHANKSTTNVIVKDVTVENVNYGVHSVYGTNVTLENYTATNVSYPVRVQNYAKRNVVLNNCTFEGCENPLTVWEKATAMITFNFKGVNDMGKADFYTSQYAKVVAAAQIGTKVYETLEAAAAEAQAGETVVLLQGTNAAVTLPAGVLLDKNGFVADNVVVTKPAVAKIGDTGYESLAAAIAAATAGQTITFAKDINESVAVSKSVTIDGNGKNYTGTMSANNGLTVTIQNVNFVNAGFSKNNDGTNGTYTLKNCTFDGQGTYAYAVLAKNIGTLKVEDCTVKNYQYGFLYVKKQSTKVSITNVAVENCASYAVYFASGVATATIEGLSVENSNNGIIWSNAGNRKLTLKDCTMDNVATAINHNGGTYTITCTVLGVNDLGTTNVSQYVKFNAGAMAGTKVYEDVNAAVAAVQAGEALTLYKDVTIAESLNGAGLTINGNGHTLTYTGKGEGARAITVESAANGADLTINNLTVDCTSSYCQRGINYNTNGTLTLDGVTVKGTNVTYALNLPGSSDGANVAINNSDLTGNIALNVWGENSVVDVVNSTLTSVDNNSAEGYAAVKLNNDGATAAEGTVINITGGKIDVTGTACNDTKAASNATATGAINISESTEVNGSVTTIVAVIRYDNGYSYSFQTIEEAIAAANAGETVTLVRDVTASAIITVDKAITIDGNGTTLTSTAGRAFNIETEGKVVISNLTVNAAERAINIINKPATVELTNVTATADNNAVMIATSAGAAQVTIDGCNFTGLAVVNVAGAKSNVAIKNSQITNVDANKDENYGAITVWSSAEEAVVNVENTTINVADDSKKAYVFPANATITGVDQVGRIIVTVGDAGYETLAEAVEKANGETIKFVMSAAGPGVVINKNAVIDFNGCTYSFNEGVGSTGTPSNGFQILKGNTVTLKNGTLNVAAEAADKFYILVQNYANLTVENMTLDGTNLDKWSKTDGDSYVLSNNCGNIYIIGNTTITRNNDGALAFALDVCKKDSYEAPVVTVGEDATINGNIEVSAALHFNGNLNGDVVINGAEGVVNAVEGLNVTTSVANSKVVYADGKYTLVAVVAQIGESTYATLSEAIAAAKANDIITLIGNVEEDVTVNKSLTIDGNGKQYTGVMALNKVNATIKNLNFVKGQISKSKNDTGGNVTIVNCNFDGQDMNTYAVNVARTGSVVIENVTAQNYGYGFLQLSHANNNLSIKNVSVTNTNYALKIDYSNGVTIDGLKVEDVKIAAIYNSNYGTKTYTITNSDFSGAVEAIKMWERNTTVYNTFVFAGGNTLGDATLSTSPYAIYQGVVAEVGTQKFLDLRAAFEAAQDGDTVKLLEDVALTEADVIVVDGLKTIYHIAKDITFDMNGKQITVSYNGGNYLYGVFLVDGKLTVTGNGTIDIPQTDRQVAYMFLKRGSEGHLVIENGYFHAGNLEDSMIYTNGNDVVTVIGGTFVIDNVAERSNGCPWIFNTKGTGTNHVNVLGGTYNFNVSKQHYIHEVKLADGLAMTKTADGLWTVASAIAAIGEDRYATLAEAVAEAVADADESDIVTLLADATGAGVVINKSITIDFGGHTYSFTEGVGSTGTPSNGFQILKNNDVTLMNGTLNVAAEAADKFYILVQNYADLTVEDMNLDGTNLDKWSTTDGDSYVLSNNSGEVVITGNTNITANNDGDKAFAFDACDKTAWGYTLPVVNVETIGKIAGLIESTATIAISSGTFTTPILPEWCAEYYVPVQNADGTYGVEKRYIDEVTIEDDGKVTEFVNEKEMTVGTLTYKRNFSKSGVGDWQGFYVPFEVPVSDLADLGYEVAYILDVHYEYDYDKFDIKGAPNTHIIKLNSGILRANHPYVIRPTKDADLNLVLQYTDATLFSTVENVIAVESSSTTHRFVFSGTYKTAKRAELNGSDDIPCYLINNDGEFQAIGPNVNIATFRVYLSIYKKDGSPVILDETAGSIKMRVIGEEDENGETVIYDVEMDGEQTSDYIYDLHGRRVMEPQKGGIYIVNGKKVVF